MGQGNAIAHLMPPPFYAFRYVVAKARAPEESISDQIAKIRAEGPTPYKRYKIEVMPGNYPEVITMVPYIDVVAPYGKVIIQPPANGDVAVTMASNCMLQGVEVNMTSIKTESGATGIVIEAANDNVIVEDCWVTGGTTDNIGISDDSSNNNINIRRCRIDSAATGYNKTGSGTTWFYDNRVTATTIDVDVDAGTLTLVECELMGTATNVDVGITGVLLTTTVNSWGNTLSGTGWVIADDDESAHAAVYSHDDRYTAVSHAGAGFMVDYESPQSYNVFNGMHIADALTDITDAVDLKRYVILVHPGEYDEAITMKAHIDLVGESNESCVIKQAGATVIAANNDSRVKNVRVELTLATATAAISCGEGIQGYFEEVVVDVAHTGGVGSACIASSSTGGFEIHDSVLEIDHADDYPVTTDGTGTHLVYDSELINTGTAGYGMNVAAGGATVTVSSFNNKLRSDLGFRIADSANAVCLSYGDDYTTVDFLGTAGEFVDLTGCRLYTCGSGVKVREWVYVIDNDTVAEADADTLATMPSMGVVVWKPGMPAADTGLTCYVKNYGYLYQADGTWVHGEEYWISAAVGEITITMHPVWPQRAGVAVSTQRFKILIGDNLGLVHCNEYLCDHDAVVHDSVGIGAWVYKTNGADQDDLVALAKADDDATMPGLGVCVARLVSVPAGNDTLLIKLRGKYSMPTPADGPGPFNPGDDIFIDPGTAGGLTSIRPIADIVQKVAEVKSEDGTTLIYEIAD